MVVGLQMGPHALSLRASIREESYAPPRADFANIPELERRTLCITNIGLDLKALILVC